MKRKPYTLKDVIEMLEEACATWDVITCNISRQPVELDPMLGECPFDSMRHLVPSDVCDVHIVLRAKKSHVPDPQPLPERLHGAYPSMDDRG